MQRTVVDKVNGGSLNSSGIFVNIEKTYRFENINKSCRNACLLMDSKLRREQSLIKQDIYASNRIGRSLVRRCSANRDKWRISSKKKKVRISQSLSN